MPTVSAAFEVPQKLPFLEAVCWQTKGVRQFSPQEMLRRYERGWEYRGVLAEPSVEELSFVKELAQHYGSWLATEQQMFNLEFHQKIVRVLHNLDLDFFRASQIYFGGGTLVSLRHGEYRVSKDIDFICPVGNSYRLLRQAVFEKGFNALFATQEGISLPGDLQTNRYGVRFSIVVDQVPIRFEIVAEERIILGEPDYPTWSPVPCLNETDSFAEKLLANSDRWGDTSVESRDLIDLSILRLASTVPEEAITKAENAYPVIEPLKRAIENFQAKPEYRERCLRSLGVEAPERVINGLDMLAADFGIELTERNFTETRIEERLEWQRTPQQLWQRYSQGIPTPIEGQQLTAIARRALQDNLDTKVITQMLLEAPYLKDLQQRQGLERAQEFARLAVRNAASQIRQAQQPQPLPKGEQGQDFGPEL